MKRNNKIIIIIGIIILLAAIAITVIITSNNMKKEQEKTCLKNEEKIKEAAKKWAIDNPNNNQATIEDLRYGAYMDLKLKNPMTGKKYNDKTRITVTKLGNGQDYSFKITYVGEEGCK